MSHKTYIFTFENTSLAFAKNTRIVVSAYDVDDAMEWVIDEIKKAIQATTGKEAKVKLVCIGQGLAVIETSVDAHSINVSVIETDRPYILK